MKIENKQMKIAKPKEEGKEQEYFTYGELLAFACEQTQNPVSLAEQRVRFKILDSIEASNGEINIDDKWLPVLKKCLDAIAVSPLSREFVELGDLIDHDEII